MDIVKVHRLHALVGGLKSDTLRFYKEKQRIRLQPANKRMKPMYFDDVQIAGKVVGLVRRLA